MGIVAKRIRIIVAGIIIGFIVTTPAQMLLPFPMGLYVGVVIWILIAIIFLVWAFVITKDSGKSPKAILEERYAKGEITKEEFDKMKGDLDN